MKVSNMISSRGNTVPNQFIIEDEGRGSLGNFIKRQVFQSYDSVIAIRIWWEDVTRTELDSIYWNYSRTTSRYRNQFLGESTKETQAKIDCGEYTLTNLN